MNMQQTSFLTGSDLVTAPRSRRADHDSSKIAAKQHQRSGRADSNAAMVLSAVHRWPGLSSKELAKKMNDYGWQIDRVEVHRRLSDLEESGAVQGTREPKKQITWGAK